MRCAPACGWSHGGAGNARATSPTSSASSRPTSQDRSMPELALPERLREVELVRSVRTPAALDYLYTAGEATSRFLRGIAQGKILGERCPTCGKVYVPPRGACPTDGVPTRDQVELANTGTIVSFCVVNVQFYGQAMEIPYVG